MKGETLFDDDSGRLQVYRNWCPDAESWQQRLQQQLHWRQGRVRVYGREHATPRLESWFGALAVRYRYSGQTLVAEGWPELVKPLVAAVCDTTEVAFNAVLANWYRDGNDRMGWHADNEAELGSNPPVASVSLGARRDFRLRRNSDHRHTLSLALGAGDLLLMDGALQHHWQHCVPKRAQAQARISLTFRRVIQATMS